MVAICEIVPKIGVRIFGLDASRGTEMVNSTEVTYNVGVDTGFRQSREDRSVIAVGTSVGTTHPTDSRRNRQIIM